MILFLYILSIKENRLQFLAVNSSYAIKKSIENTLQRLNYVDILWIKRELESLNMVNNVKF